MQRELQADVERAISDIRLLDHPFYKRWIAGELSPGELTEYAEQYRYFEAALPSFLRELIDGLPEGSARDFVAANLADEAGDPPHIDLFDGFLAAAGGQTTAQPTPATQNLLDAYRSVGHQGGSQAIGGLVAYETQAAEVARTKAQGLKEHYGYDDDGSRFWDVHATADVEHAEWALQALAITSGEDTGLALNALRAVGEAWWAFLDERQAAAA